MKSLTVLRHAKAARPEEYAADLERPLTRRGHEDARCMSRLLKRLEPPVDWIISSPSQRTRETAEHVAKALGFTRPVVWIDTIYEANASTLITLLKQLPAEVEHAVLVGHNPGMEELVSGLSAGTPPRLSLRMRPAALAFMTLDVLTWNLVRWGCGQLELLADPKLLCDG
jgi:phosphohistidine phosphatase